MRLYDLYDDVFQSMLDYLEYEEIARLSQTHEEVFIICDDYVQHDVGVSVADLYHFVPTAFGSDCGDSDSVSVRSDTFEKIEISDDTPLWDAIVILA